jgi:ssRNA-specific RNase YbeY (16S rRNA maturation enzyme)
MTIEVTILISIVSVSAAIFFGIKSAKRADVSDIEERAKKNAEINFKLDNLLTIVSSMKDEMKELTSRLSKDEKETEVLALKYDELEKRVGKLEGK